MSQTTQPTLAQKRMANPTSPAITSGRRVIPGFCAAALSSTASEGIRSFSGYSLKAYGKQTRAAGKRAFFLVCWILCRIASAAPVTLAWDKNAEPDVSSYALKIGTASGVYDHTFSTEATEQAADLTPGVFYFAVVTAIDTSGLESLPSKELCFQVFAPGQGVPPKPPTGLRKMTIRVTLLSSPDLRVWTPEDEWDFSTDLPALFFKLAIR